MVRDQPERNGIYIQARKFALITYIKSSVEFVGKSWAPLIAWIKAKLHSLWFFAARSRQKEVARISNLPAKLIYGVPWCGREFLLPLLNWRVLLSYCVEGRKVELQEN